jgi:hypothetical protein
MSQTNRSFRLRIAAENMPNVAACVVGPLTVMCARGCRLWPARPSRQSDACSRYRLKVVEQPPVTWYKDQGGRDKAMTVRVALVDDKDTVRPGR